MNIEAKKTTKLYGPSSVKLRLRQKQVKSGWLNIIKNLRQMAARKKLEKKKILESTKIKIEDQSPMSVNNLSNCKSVRKCSVFLTNVLNDPAAAKYPHVSNLLKNIKEKKRKDTEENKRKYNEENIMHWDQDVRKCTVLLTNVLNDPAIANYPDVFNLWKDIEEKKRKDTEGKFKKDNEENKRKYNEENIICDKDAHKIDDVDEDDVDEVSDDADEVKDYADEVIDYAAELTTNNCDNKNKTLDSVNCEDESHSKSLLSREMDEEQDTFSSRCSVDEKETSRNSHKGESSTRPSAENPIISLESDSEYEDDYSLFWNAFDNDSRASSGYHEMIEPNKMDDFLLSVLPSIRRIPPHRQAYFKMKVLQLIREEENYSPT